MNEEDHNKGRLYLCPTPIGNLEDITYRVVRILSEVDYIAAEDTRHTGQLLQAYDIKKPIISYHEHNKEDKNEHLWQLLEEGQSIGLVSDAGMPIISDPGNDLVEGAIARGIEVVPLPGPNAALTALMASGLGGGFFTFVGFLPKKEKHRQELLSQLKGMTHCLIFYEAPHRIVQVLEDMYQFLGNRKVVLGRELTKKFETFTYSTLEDIQQSTDMFTIKGEFVILLGPSLEEAEQDKVTLADTVEEVLHLVREGFTKKEAVKEIAKKYDIPKRDVYNTVEQTLKERS